MARPTTTPDQADMLTATARRTPERWRLARASSANPGTQQPAERSPATLTRPRPAARRPPLHPGWHLGCRGGPPGGPAGRRDARAIFLVAGRRATPSLRA